MGQTHVRPLRNRRLADWCCRWWRSDPGHGVVNLLVAFALLFSAWSVQAQQLMPELDSQRQYITFSQAAPKIFAAAVQRAKPKTTDQAASTQDSYNRALEYAKQIGTKLNADQAGNAFSFMSFLPSLVGGKIYGETISYTFGSGTLSVVADRDAGAFRYRMRPTYQSTSTGASFNPAVRIYNPELDFTFKNMPRIVGGAYSLTTLCTSSTAACSVLQAYAPGRYKWFYREGTSPFMVACNQVSDCIQAMISYDFYNKTWKLRKQGYDSAGQYYGGYAVRPSGNCVDSSDLAYLQTLLPGLSCLFSLQYNYTLSGSDTTFRVTGDFESPYVRYIALNPIPLVCPGATKYHQFATCDARFESDVLSPKSIALLVDRMFFWGAQRFGYRGLQYVPVTVADVISAIGDTLVKVSTLGEATAAPTAEPPAPAASSPGTGGTTGPKLDLGPDPGIPAPSLDSVSSSSVLAPVFSLFPSLAAYSPGGHTAQCPTFTPSVFGATLHVDGHCDLLEGQRTALGLVSLVAWAVVALRVVLRA